MILSKYYLRFSFVLSWVFMFMIQVEMKKKSFVFDVYGESYGGYYISINLGSPPQEINVLLDSGSSNFAIAVDPNEVNVTFNYMKSSTFHKLDKTVTIHYTEGSWSGFFAKDDIKLCSDPFCVLNLQFACITSSDKVFESSTNWSGILGLAYPNIAKPEKYAESFMESVMLTNISDIFSLSLCGPFICNPKMTTTKGQFLIGDINSSLYSGDIIYTPIIKEWFYEIIVTGLEVGNETFNGSCSLFNNDRSIVDTGSTFLSFPEEIYTWTIAKIKQMTGSYSIKLPETFWTQQTVECLNIRIYNLFPPLKISLYHAINSSFLLNISPELYLLKFPSSSSNEFCIKLAISMMKKTTVIGATILKGFYIIFDRQNKRIGFANSTCTNCAVSSNVSHMVLHPVYSEKVLSDCKLSNIHKGHNIYIYIIFAISLVCSVTLVLLLASWIRCKLKKQKRSSLEESHLVYNVLS